MQSNEDPDFTTFVILYQKLFVDWTPPDVKDWTALETGWHEHFRLSAKDNGCLGTAKVLSLALLLP